MKLDKRYWVFAQQHYYPSGGLKDIIAVSDDIEKIKERIYESTTDNELTWRRPGNSAQSWDTMYIFDSQERRIVWADGISVHDYRDLDLFLDSEEL